jgi:4-hydroxy-tetrahydrodipicolinate reductase
MHTIILSGCNGRMGQAITRLINEYQELQIVAGITRNPGRLNNPYPTFVDFDELKGIKADVLLDFSNPSLLSKIVEYGLKTGTALVIGTTGLSSADYEKLREASELIPVFASANMSFGISVLTDLVLKAARTLGEGYDIEILEKHHRGKKDSPSGTAIMIADALNNVMHDPMDLVIDRSKSNTQRKVNEIGISTIRAGTLPGEHSVFFAGKDEILELKHSALTRDSLARGAIKAVQYTVEKKKGFYDMKLMLKEMG